MKGLLCFFFSRVKTDKIGNACSTSNMSLTSGCPSQTPHFRGLEEFCRHIDIYSYSESASQKFHSKAGFLTLSPKSRIRPGTVQFTQFKHLESKSSLVLRLGSKMQAAPQRASTWIVSWRWKSFAKGEASSLWTGFHKTSDSESLQQASTKHRRRIIIYPTHTRTHTHNILAMHSLFQQQTSWSFFDLFRGRAARSISLEPSITGVTWKDLRISVPRKEFSVRWLMWWMGCMTCHGHISKIGWQNNQHLETCQIFGLAWFFVPMLHGPKLRRFRRRTDIEKMQTICKPYGTMHTAHM